MSVFSRVKKHKTRYSNFNLTHERKFPCGIGELVPIMCEEVVAGDTFQNTTELLIRFAPLIAPVMHQINVYTHFFFVPNRLLWEDWEDFITGGEDGQSDLVPPMLQFKRNTADWLSPGTLADYLGIPSPQFAGSDDAALCSALPFRAYTQVYNDYYRDQNLEDEIDFDKRGGIFTDPDGTGLSKELKTRCWSKDYFTSALPFAQRGNDISVPLDIDLQYNSRGATVLRDSSGVRIPADNPTQPTYNKFLKVRDPNTGSIHAEGEPPSNLSVDMGDDSHYAQANVDNSQNLKATAANITVRTLRRLFAAQRFEENNATGGSRYIEQLLLRFGVVSDDARLQRAEYLGGGKQPIVISETLQTSETTESSPQGTQSGQGTSAGRTKQFKRRFKEHGWVIGIMSVLPKPAYMNGLRRQFLRLSRYDYLTPEFANIGEQEVSNNEVFWTGQKPNDKGPKTFGYQGRYNEYRYIPSTVHGTFRTSLDFWHLAREFTGTPTLSAQFMHVKPDSFKRIFAVSDLVHEQMYVQLINHTFARRALPKFPGT